MKYLGSNDCIVMVSRLINELLQHQKQIISETSFLSINIKNFSFKFSTRQFPKGSQEALQYRCNSIVLSDAFETIPYITALRLTISLRVQALRQIVDPVMGNYSQSILLTDQRTNAVVDSRRIRMIESAFVKFYRACLLIMLINRCTCETNDETNGKSIDSVIVWSAIAVSIAMGLVMIEQRCRIKEVGPSYDFPLHHQSGSPFPVKLAHTSVADIQLVSCLSLEDE
jgi:hypothetical protein